ncbi:hypothetical protein FQN57_000527 [Myotisia sp. PD_48]|nr:hypothetical protein FQN57_000527 [Myotisia sp. PD_48]
MTELESPIPQLLMEYHGIDPPPGISIPTVSELLSLCTEEHPWGYPMGLAYPADNPIFWIKYGGSVVPNEIFAQAMAYHELRRLNSPVRAPGIFYACNVNHIKYIVMEYISGRSGAQVLKDIDNLTGKEPIYRQIAFAISELLRIPVKQSHPSAVNGEHIRHTLFDMEEAPRLYQTVEQLEQHLNGFLALTKCKARVQDLSREPLVFCHSDLHPGNFLIDQDGHIVVIDFADASILPSSFAKSALYFSADKFECNIIDWVDVPGMEGFNNLPALFAVAQKMVMRSSSFSKIGTKVPGFNIDAQESINTV